MKTGRVLMLTLALVLILVGCQENDDPGEVVTFAQSSTTLDGRLTIGHPEEWVTTLGETQMTLANSQNVLAIRDVTAIPAGQITGTVNVLLNSDLRGLELEENPNAGDILNALLDRQQFLSFDLDYNRFDTGGRSAVVASGKVNNDGNEYGTIFALVRFDTVVVLFNFNTAFEGEEAFEAVVEDIVRATTYGVPATNEEE